MTTFWRIPRDSSPGSDRSLPFSSSSSMRAARPRVEVVDAVEPRHQPQVLVDGQILEQVRLVGHERQPPFGLDAASVAPISKPSIRTVPVDGLRMPASVRSVVVLPAPLGPISPTISPAADLERQAVDGDEGPVSARQLLDRDRHGVC